MTTENQSAEWAQDEALPDLPMAWGWAQMFAGDECPILRGGYFSDGQRVYTAAQMRAYAETAARALHARVQELEREAHSLRKDAERFRFANESEEDFAICYWDEQMGNGGEWMCYSDKGYAIDVLDAAIRARGAQGDVT